MLAQRQNGPINVRYPGLFCIILESFPLHRQGRMGPIGVFPFPPASFLGEVGRIRVKGAG